MPNTSEALREPSYKDWIRERNPQRYVEIYGSDTDGELSVAATNKSHKDNFILRAARNKFTGAVLMGGALFGAYEVASNGKAEAGCEPYCGVTNPTTAVNVAPTNNGVTNPNFVSNNIDAKATTPANTSIKEVNGNAVMTTNVASVQHQTFTSEQPKPPVIILPPSTNINNNINQNINQQTQSQSQSQSINFAISQAVQQEVIREVVVEKVVEKPVEKIVYAAPVPEKPVYVAPAPAKVQPLLCPDGTELPPQFQKLDYLSKDAGTIARLEEIKCEILKAEKDHAKQLEMLDLLQKGQIDQLEILMGKDLNGNGIIGPDLNDDGKADGPSVPETVKADGDETRSRIQKLFDGLEDGAFKFKETLWEKWDAVASTIAAVGVLSFMAGRPRRFYGYRYAPVVQPGGGQIQPPVQPEVPAPVAAAAVPAPEPAQPAPAAVEGAPAVAPAVVAAAAVPAPQEQGAVEPGRFTDAQIQVLATVFEAIDRVFNRIDEMSDNAIRARAAQLTDEQIGAIRQAIIFLSEDDVDEDELNNLSRTRLIRRLSVARRAINPIDAVRIARIRQQLRQAAA